MPPAVKNKGQSSKPAPSASIKAPPEKLREATSRSSRNGRDSFQGGEIISGPRSTRNRKVVVEESSEEEEQDDDAEGEEIEVEEDEDIDMDDEDDEDAEGEEDEDMDDPPLPTHMSSNRNPPKPSVKVTPADIVEAKEMAMVDDPSDDESSELSEADEDEEGLGDEDAEGEELDEDEEDAEGDEDSELDSPSGSGTPDMSKLTRRQRKAYEEYDGGLMALSNEAQKKKHLTAEEHASRRAEMARRRKNLSEKRNEEEKMDTINRLLKKQAPKRRGRAAAVTLEGESGAEEEQEPERAPALYNRYIQTREGVVLALPQEWLDAPVGDFIGRVSASKSTDATQPRRSGRMVEEVS